MKRIRMGLVRPLDNTTPNYLHLAALKAANHVISYKPLAMNSVEAEQLRDWTVASGVAHVVTLQSCRPTVSLLP